MPTILRTGAYRFFFYSADAEEPRHVHVERGDALAKFWLDPPRLARSAGFKPPELRRIRGIIIERHAELAECWNEYFGQ
jgi:hypothetical protein